MVQRVDADAVPGGGRATGVQGRARHVRARDGAVVGSGGEGHLRRCRRNRVHHEVERGRMAHGLSRRADLPGHGADGSLAQGLDIDGVERHSPGPARRLDPAREGAVRSREGQHHRQTIEARAGEHERIRIQMLPADPGTARVGPETRLCHQGQAVAAQIAPIGNLVVDRPAHFRELGGVEFREMLGEGRRGSLAGSREVALPQTRGGIAHGEFREDAGIAEAPVSRPQRIVRFLLRSRVFVRRVEGGGLDPAQVALRRDHVAGSVRPDLDQAEARCAEESRHDDLVHPARIVRSHDEHEIVATADGLQVGFRQLEDVSGPEREPRGPGCQHHAGVDRARLQHLQDDTHVQPTSSFPRSGACLACLRRS